MSVNVGGYGNLIFKNESVYDQFKNDPQSMTYSQGPGGRKYVEPKAADYETRFKGAEFGGTSGGGGAKPNTDEELTSGRSAMKRGGKVKKMASGGVTSKVSSASKRADGIAVKGKTRGKCC